jgi:uncharacterized protein
MSITQLLGFRSIFAMTDEMPAEFWQGIEQFNQRQFYACHDTLEALWMEAAEPEKTVYQGILQIAVALYHLENQNLRGAIILLGEGMNRLRRYLPNFAGLNLEQLLQESRLLQATLQQIQHPSGTATVGTSAEQPMQHLHLDQPETVLKTLTLPTIQLIEATDHEGPQI